METQRWEENHVFRRLRRHPTQKLAFHKKIQDQLEDTFDVLESIAIGLFCADQVKHVLMGVGMNCPSVRILLFPPSFRMASRASCCVHLAAVMCCVPFAVLIP